MEHICTRNGPYRSFRLSFRVPKMTFLALRSIPIITSVSVFEIFEWGFDLWVVQGQAHTVVVRRVEKYGDGQFKRSPKKLKSQNTINAQRVPMVQVQRRVILKGMSIVVGVILKVVRFRRVAVPARRCQRLQNCHRLRYIHQIWHQCSNGMPHLWHMFTMAPLCSI